MKKTYTKEKFKNREKWLDSRSIGGSSASAILGYNPRLNKLELYDQLVNGKRKEEKENEAIKYGNACEGILRKHFALSFKDKYKVQEHKEIVMYRDIKKPYLTATLDGELLDLITHEKGILEIKTHDVRNKEDLEIWANGLPQNYFVQILHYLLVRKDMTFAVLYVELRFYDYSNGKKYDHSEMRHYFVKRSEVQNQIDYLEKKETEFYEEFVVNRKLPNYEIKL